MRVLLYLSALLVAIFGFGLLLRLVNPLPSLEGRSESTAITDTADTRLGRALSSDMAAHPGLSGIFPLAGAKESFAARVLLIRAAQRSIDVQYYIWLNDISGSILLDEIRQAADRGVRVRLLLDDNGTAGMDDILGALDTHPNIEVRLFNPFTIRKPKTIGYIMDFPRLNRRMHNKSLTVDNQATIVGGRNIGDAYFGASRESLFADLDVLAVGAIVPEVSADFDRYWASRSAYPAPLIVGAVTGKEAILAKSRVKANGNSPLARDYARAVRETILRDTLTRSGMPYDWVPVSIVTDDPAKALGKEKRGDRLMEQLGATMGRPTRSVGLVSAYFVPTDKGTEAFAAMARSGVDVSILTNALNATDVAVVHAGYARHRRPLLEAGVALWEMKGGGHEGGRGDVSLSIFGSGSGSGSAGNSRPVLRSSRSSLHAKTFTTDGKRLFVGSFNFDPRSAHLNTEMGFVIESEGLAGQLESMIANGLDEYAYRLRLAPDGKALEWVEKGPEGTIIHTTEPGTTMMERGLVHAMALLPIDWML